MNATVLKDFFDRDADGLSDHPELGAHLEALLAALENGSVRSATYLEGRGWQAEAWVKRAILCIFRTSPLRGYDDWPGGAFDKAGLPPRRFSVADAVRLVPGGSTVRRGACVEAGVVIMPPAYINVGAYVGAGTMVDSHALVGSCAQVGQRVHLSAGVQIGGVLEPTGACPVVVEDDCFLGALSGLFEGVVLERGAVLAPGVCITASTEVYDLVGGCTYRGRIPAGAVVVPGSRPAGGAWAAERGLSLYAPCIVKYRDQATSAATALEAALR